MVWYMNETTGDWEDDGKTLEGLPDSAPSLIDGLDPSSIAGSQSGRLFPGDFSGKPATATVVLPKPYPDAAYQVRYSYSVDNPAVVFLPSTVNPTSASFVCSLNTGNISNLLDVGWYAFRPGA